jgi:hypothetical protein
LLVEKRPSNIALVKPDAAVHVAETVGLKPIGHADKGREPHSPKTTGPEASESPESKWMWTPFKLLVKPVATTVMDTEVGDSCLKMTVADPAGDPTDGRGLSCAMVATNCRSQRLGTKTETATAEAVDPKFEPTTVMVCVDATRCAAETKETVGFARDRAGVGRNVKSGKLKVFEMPWIDNSSAIPKTSWACTLNGVCAQENEVEVNAPGMMRQGDTTVMKTFDTSEAVPKLEIELRSIDCRVTLVGVGFEDTV